MAMIFVTCESCKTKFRLDPNRVKGPKSRLRCSRCGHIFEVNQPEEDDVLVHVDISEEELAGEDNLTAPRPTPGISKPAPSKKKSLHRTLLIWAIPLLVLGVGLLWLAGNRGSLSQSVTESGEKLSPGDVQEPSVTILDSTQAYFLENAHGGQVFVVEGEIVNESKKPVSFILLEGKLYTRTNHIAQSQRCFSGNIMTRNELTHLSISEIQNRMMNREGKELMNVHIPHAKRVPFMLVFHNLPDLDSLGDYSIEVISAKAE